jgi:hypothetical protein
MAHNSYGFQTFPLSPGDENYQCKSIYITNSTTSECIDCKNGLIVWPNCIPISETECARFSGRLCEKCGKFFVEYSERVKNLLCDNKYAADFSIDFSFYCSEYEEYRELFLSDPKHQIMVLIKAVDTNDFEIYIITSKTDATNHNKSIILYSTCFARSLLTSAIKDKKRIVVKNDQKFVVVGSLYNRDCRDSSNLNFILSEVRIKEKGGYLSSIVNKFYELVDVLLYSPFTSCYEIAHATYYKGGENSKEDGGEDSKEEYDEDERDYYYMDITVYRDFARNYGNPQIRIGKGFRSHNDFILSRNNNSMFDNMNPESLLHAYGYNVNQKENLSDKFRRDLLSEMLDLKNGKKILSSS